MLESDLRRGNLLRVLMYARLSLLSQGKLRVSPPRLKRAVKYLRLRDMCLCLRDLDFDEGLTAEAADFSQYYCMALSAGF